MRRCFFGLFAHPAFCCVGWSVRFNQDGEQPHAGALPPHPRGVCRFATTGRTARGGRSDAPRARCLHQGLAKSAGQEQVRGGAPSLAVAEGATPELGNAKRDWRLWRSLRNHRGLRDFGGIRRVRIRRNGRCSGPTGRGGQGWQRPKRYRPDRLMERTSGTDNRGPAGSH